MPAAFCLFFESFFHLNLNLVALPIPRTAPNVFSVVVVSKSQAFWYYAT